MHCAIGTLAFLCKQLSICSLCDCATVPLAHLCHTLLLSAPSQVTTLSQHLHNISIGFQAYASPLYIPLFNEHPSVTYR